MENRKRQSTASKMACGQCGAAPAGEELFDEEASLTSFELKEALRIAGLLDVDVAGVVVTAYMDGGHPRLRSVSATYI